MIVNIDLDFIVLVVTPSHEASMGSLIRGKCISAVGVVSCVCVCGGGGLFSPLTLLSRNCFLCTQCPQTSVLLFKDGLNIKKWRISPAGIVCTLFLVKYNGFTLLMISHLMLKCFQTWSLSFVAVL